MMSRYYGGLMMGGSPDNWMMGGTSAPGPRVSAAQAIRLGSQVLAGASINRAANTVTFGAASTHLVAVASLAGGPMRPSASPG